ncbi:MAG TPA: alcohol dehydrogenase, partial [Spirochaetia bacterium]|nr:alcohol dehydrogenase [Spirochaetia bacterium]
RISFFGGLPKNRPTITFDSNLVHYKELEVTATTACSTHDCMRAADLLNSGRIDLSPLVSIRRTLDDAGLAFAEAQGGEALKVVFEL